MTLESFVAKWSKSELLVKWPRGAQTSGWGWVQ